MNDDLAWPDGNPEMGPALAAVHAARSALTVAGGRVALARRYAERNDAVRVADNLAHVPGCLAEIASAVDRLVAAAARDPGAAPDAVGGHRERRP